MMAGSFHRKGHGKGAGRPHIEVPPADELSFPIAAPEAPSSAPLTFRHDGKIGDSATAKELGRRGGEARARRVRLVDSLGLATIAADTTFAPYRSAAEVYVAHHLAELAKVAGGHVGPGPSTMIASAALQLAASRFLFDRFASTLEPSDAKAASSLADAHRQNTLAAYELAVREAQARPRQQHDPLAAWRESKASP